MSHLAVVFALMTSKFNSQQVSPGTPTSWIDTEVSSACCHQSDGTDRSSNRDFPMLWGFGSYTFSLSADAYEVLWPLWNDFKDSVLVDEDDTDPSGLPFQPLEILFRFLGYAVKDFETHNYDDCTPYANEVLDALNEDFIKSHNIHSVVSALGVSLERQRTVLAAYYLVIQYTNRNLRVNESLLWTPHKPEELRICSIFTGQGNANSECLNDLRDIWTTYKPLLQDLISSTASFLRELSQSSDTTDFYDNDGLDIRNWLDDRESSPDPALIASAPFSFPIIGLINLANFCIMCKVTNMTPGAAIAAMQAITGHSQGIVVAACVAKAKTWEEFYDAARLSLQILFWTGYESHQDAPISIYSARQTQDSLKNGEGIPSHMLSVRGLPRHDVENILKTANKNLAKDQRVSLALVNSRDNLVLAGPPRSLRGITLHLRTLKAADGLDQSRVPHNKRKGEIFSQFLPISAPFHSTYLVDATSRILDRLAYCVIKGNDLKTTVVSTSTGSDLRGARNSNIVPELVKMVTSQLVDWPVASRLPGATHIIEFGPGQFSALMHQTKDGTGARVIAGGSLKPSDGKVGSKVELFAHAPTLSRSSQNWEIEFGPQVTKTASGQDIVTTKFSKLLKLPPVMVAGMTPTTVPWDFVAAVSNAGFHVELAAGGYFSPDAFKQAILNVTSNIAAGRGLAINLIYVNPRAIAWQIPLIKQLIREGVPIDGITIGAGVPSAEVAHDYITTIGLQYIGFKPGSLESVKQVIDIAQAHPGFPIIMQWTGGRGGGHHSFEDFHTPMLQMYGRIRKCPNIVLVAGSGFGDAEDSYSYLTGDWARELGYPKMPFDAILLGSRMMVAKEAHTSVQAKRAIVEAKGVADGDWASSYDRATGGVITVLSEMGQPIHKIATRGVLFWSEMDRMIFSLKGEKRLDALQNNKAYIIRKLNADYSKVWFPKDASGEPVDLDEMTYHEIILRMIELMYVAHQSRWIDQSYKAIVSDLLWRICERFTSQQNARVYDLERPLVLAQDLVRHIPQCQEQLISPEDVKFFLSICKRPGRKPVNFVPCLNEDFELFFKKDSLWQAEDVEAVIDQDVGRVCILQGPMAAHYSTKIDEPAFDILNGIHEAYIANLKECPSNSGDFDLRKESAAELITAPDLPNVAFEMYDRKMRFTLDKRGDLPDPEDWFAFIANKVSGWAQKIFGIDFILQWRTKVANPFRRIFSPQHAMILEIDDFEDAEECRVGLRTLTQNSCSYRQTVNVVCKHGHLLIADVFEFRKRGQDFATLPLKFKYDATNESYPISEIMDDRTDRIKNFYSQLWFGKRLSMILEKTHGPKFVGSPVTLTSDMISKFTQATGGKRQNSNMKAISPADVSIDIAILASWEVLMKPLLCHEVEGDLLRLVHRSNSFKYVPGATPLKVGYVLHSTSRIQGVFIEDSGKVVDVSAIIKCDGRPVIEVNSTFLFQGAFKDFENTFKVVKEPSVSLDVRSKKMQAILRGQEWFVLDNNSKDVVGEMLRFEPKTRLTYAGKNKIDSLEVSGKIYSASVEGHPKEIGSIDYAATRCVGNPVTDFLNRWGSPVDEVTRLKNPNKVDEGEATNFIAPRSNEPYGRVSGDFNPIHVSEMFASYANLPGTVTHGMYTSVAVRRIVENWMAGGESRRFHRWSASFTGMLLPRDKVQVKMSHTGMIQGRKLVEVTALNERSGDTVLKAEAEIEEPRTAYVFTGQGSQAKGMGMETYASSAVSREIWDKADKHMIENYGASNLLSSPRTMH